MTLSELKSACLKYTTFYTKSQIEQLWNAFFSTLQQAIQSRNLSIEPSRTQLYEALNIVDEFFFSSNEWKIVSIYGGASVRGDVAVADIEEVLRDQNFDPAGVIQKVNTIRSVYMQLQSQFSQILPLLSPVEEKQDYVLGPDQAVLQLTFENDEMIENIVDFDKWVDTWKKIIINVGSVGGVRPEEARILYVQKSSPLVIDIALVIGTIRVVVSIAKKVMELIEQYLMLKKQQLEIQKMKLKNKKIESEFEIEITEFRKDIAAQVMQYLVEEKLLDKITPEQKNGIALSIGMINDFVENGGSVDVVAYREEEKIEEAKMVAERVTSIRKIEAELKQMKRIEQKTAKADI